MKKTPILLSTMALTIGSLGLGMPVTATDSSQLKNESEVLNNDPITGNSLSPLAAISSKDKTFLDGGEQNPIFHLLSVDYKTNQLGIRIYEQDGWQIKRVVIAYRNYENGITEAEADQKLVTLGVADSTVWKVLWDYDAKGAKSLYYYASPQENRKKLPLGDNLTDIVYYAVEYGYKTDAGWQDNWWMRGKINYRNCAHSSVFDPETMICVESGDGSYSVKTASYEAVAMPEEEVISWDEEWNAVLRQRYEETRDRLVDLRNYLYNTAKILDGADSSLGNLAVTLPKTEGMEDRDEIMAEIARLQDLSRTLREYYANLGNTADKTELESLQREVEELKSENERLQQGTEGSRLEKERLQKEMEGLKSENESLVGAKSQIEQENIELRRQIATLKETKTGEVEDTATAENVVVPSKPEVDQKQVEELVATTETKVVVVERDAKEVQDVETGNREKEETQAADGRAGDAVDTVTVPNLGDLEEGTKINLWWVLIAGVGLMAGIGLGLSRLVRHRNQDKRK